MQQYRRKIRAVILVVLIILISLLLIRFIIEFSSRGGGNVLTDALLLVTGIFAAPFGSIKVAELEISTIFGMLFFIAAGYIASKFITGLERESDDEKFLETLEVIIRIIEIFIIFRIILKLVGADASTSIFVGIIYFLTNWTQGILPSIDFLVGTLEVSSLIILGLIIILDLNTNIIIRSIKFIGGAGAISGIVKSTSYIFRRGQQPSEEVPPESDSVEQAITPPAEAKPDEKPVQGSTATQIPENNESSKPTIPVVINLPIIQTNGKENPQIPPIIISNGQHPVPVNVQPVEVKPQEINSPQSNGKDEQEGLEKNDEPANQDSENNQGTDTTSRQLNNQEYPYSESSLDYSDYANNNNNSKKKPNTDTPQEG